jgi:tRNA 2-thiouridine synthesizing protein E
MINTKQNPTYSPTGNTESELRAREIENWTDDQARQQARNEGMELGDDHLKVIHFLREFYVEYGWPKKTHELKQILDRQFEQQGGNKYLHQLFPDGPINQGSKLAGVPSPDYVVDESFGTAL